MKKDFDCVEMKRSAQERIYRETQGLSRQEELEYFHRAAKEFREEIKRKRAESAKSGHETPSR